MKQDKIIYLINVTTQVKQIEMANTPTSFFGTINMNPLN